MPSKFPTFALSVAARMEDPRSRFAANIKRERKSRGETPLEVAFAIGVDPRTYERWEAASVDPQPKKLKSLADYWRVQIKDLWPDLEAEENELRDQLNRIEDKLDRTLSWLPRLVAALPDDAAAELAGALERLAEQDERRRDKPAEGQRGRGRRQA